MLLVCFIFAVWCSMSVSVANSELPPCPTWMYRQNAQDSDCICGREVHDAIKCHLEKNSVTIMRYFCIILSEDLNTTFIGTCPYSTGGSLPKNKSELRGFDGLCSFYQRRGQLCGACEENCTLPVYSYYLGCVNVRITSMGGSSSLLPLFFH